ncbi:hypothetical protein DM01DRAFT_1379579 [Hesseltinella vesiculosa]|uniref:Uncharacterized protein n=1 Tax=Hesseltinella vesiculosa TaxID=101127 RepID=A0A1X2GYB2_9FUNG|nr:hypothetical protein DM01DRAFT_1379579 [Hesseltinella vesiculosa]
MIDHMLTYGQACCLVLSLPPTDENRKKANDYFDGSLLEVCFVGSLGPMRPIAIGKDVMARDPFTFQSYTTTRPSTPSDAVECSSGNPTCSALLKQTMSSTEPNNKERYEKIIVCKDVLNEILTEYFGEGRVAQPSLEQWLGSDGSFGRSTRLTFQGCKKRGRWLWVLKEQ